MLMQINGVRQPERPNGVAAPSRIRLVDGHPVDHAPMIFLSPRASLIIAIATALLVCSPAATFAAPDDPFTDFDAHALQALGYWKEEGLDVTVTSVEGSAAGMQQLAAGNLQIVSLGPEEIVVATKVEFDGDLSVAELARVIDALEVDIRAVEPRATLIFVEPDVYRDPA